LVKRERSNPHAIEQHGQLILRGGDSQIIVCAATLGNRRIASRGCGLLRHRNWIGTRDLFFESALASTGKIETVRATRFFVITPIPSITRLSIRAIGSIVLLQTRFRRIVVARISRLSCIDCDFEGRREGHQSVDLDYPAVSANPSGAAPSAQATFPSVRAIGGFIIS